jgi:hypothetical protein
MVMVKVLFDVRCPGRSDLKSLTSIAREIEEKLRARVNVELSTRIESLSIRAFPHQKTVVVGNEVKAIWYLRVLAVYSPRGEQTVRVDTIEAFDVLFDVVRNVCEDSGCYVDDVDLRTM